MSGLDHDTDTTFRHVFKTEGGGQIRYVAAHGRVLVIERSADGRRQLTTTVDDLDAAEHTGHRILEVTQVARAQRREREGA